MPDYDECLSRARSTAAGEIDRSAVDYAWATTALKRGYSADEVTSELELTIAQQCESLEAAQQANSDIEMTTLDEIYSETIPGAKRGRGAKYTNEHQRRVELRSRLRSNSTYNSVRDSQRGRVREKARLTARLHRLEAFRQMLLADIEK